MPYDQALKFVKAGYAPSVVRLGGEVMSGHEAVGRREEYGDLVIECAGSIRPITLDPPAAGDA